MYPDDRAAGVVILQSPRSQKKYLGHGSPCERICWVRLKGPTSNLFIMHIYQPHRARVQPAQHNTLESLTELLRRVDPKDCTVILHHLNEQLPANIHGDADKWTASKASENAGDVIDIMKIFDLFAHYKHQIQAGQKLINNHEPGDEARYN